MREKTSYTANQTMHTDENYMRRGLQLAANGKGQVAPNPMVGAVVVHDGKIIGEGYHRKYGEGHAEVNAINSVKDKSLLQKSTIYVSLEPCSHYGKTPPCSQLIIDSKIPKVVIATLDPYIKVAGRGVKMLKEAGIEVITGVLEAEARELNKNFFMAQEHKRPYVYLKWAQTKDGFIDKKRIEGEPIQPTPISNSQTRMLVHKIRSEVSSIMVATNTVINDNPSLTTRHWAGKNPCRVILDRTGRIPHDYKVLDDQVETILVTENDQLQVSGKNTQTLHVAFDEQMIPNLFSKLNEKKIDSILIEGGASILKSIIDAGNWDEAYIEISDISFGDGTKAPIIDGTLIKDSCIDGSQCLHLLNSYKHKIL